MLADLLKNNPDLVVFAITTLGGLIWKKGRDTKLDDLWERLLKLGHQALPVLLSDPRLFNDAYVRAKIESAMWAGLERIKIKRAPWLEKLVDEAADHIKGELAEAIWKTQMGKFVETQSQTLDILKAQNENTP